jgi:hypothetical protein
MICKQFLPTGSYPTIISCDFQPSLYRCQNHPSDCLGAAPGPHATDEHFWFRQWRLKAVLKLHHHQHKPRELLWKHIKIDYIFGNYIKIFKHIYINHLCIYIYIYRERERFGGQPKWFGSLQERRRPSAFGKSAVSFSDMISSVFWDQRDMNKRMLVLGFQKDSHCSMNRESGKPPIEINKT